MFSTLGFANVFSQIKQMSYFHQLEVVGRDDGGEFKYNNLTGEGLNNTVSKT